MDINLMKKKLADKTKPKEKKKFEKIDYTKIYFKPKAGKQVIRVVPLKTNKSDPFTELYMHYGFKKFPILSLKSFGEKDPIDDFAQSLFKSSDKEDWEMGKKLKSKQRVFLPVIVRGEEEKGVRLWEFGTSVHNELLAIAADEDYGDFTNVSEGFDFTLEGTEKESFGKPIISVSIRPKPKSSVLSDDEEQVEKWLNEQPSAVDQFAKMTFDELKEVLQGFLNVQDETPETKEEVEEKVEKKEKGTAKGNSTKAKTSNTDKFNDLFDN